MASRLDTISNLAARGHRLVAEDEELLWEARRAEEEEKAYARAERWLRENICAFSLLNREGRDQWITSLAREFRNHS